ncbi:hypothetical protein PGTUg99_013728 [Puccinia graminis f. sp. tritici]|uniref:Uncharacterized protein n=1 Tax=Puccinia graminis f. sp. tritici TaxID=56615 RepID=A0A5B0NDK9_PUCGR|nr:hypothetical protein PGTUg99_013728 [Puccinia graminis f. sp. tritici]
MPQQLPISVWPPDTPPLSETIIKSHPSGNKHSAILTRPQLGSAKLRPTSTHVLQFAYLNSSVESEQLNQSPSIRRATRWRAQAPLAKRASFRGSLREVPPARRGPPVPLERGDCAKLDWTPTVKTQLKPNGNRVA